MRTIPVGGALFVLAAVALGGPAGESKPEAKTSPVYGIDETVAGKTYREWTIAWFRWAYGQPKDRSPVLDTTGKHAAEAQSGPVWFLGGNFGGTMKRQLTVPAGRPIFSVVLNSFGTSEASNRKNMDAARDLEVTLDGKSIGDVTKMRVASGSFEFTGPEKGAAVHPALAGTRTWVMDGYWFMLRPLPPGEHTVRVRGRLEGGSFELDITYQVKVLERKKT